MLTLRATGVVLSATCSLSAVQADTLPGSEPLAIKNLSPLSADRLLPEARSAVIQQGVSVAFGYTLGSHFIDASRSGETLLLDGESADAVLDLRFGLAKQWDARLRLPYRRHMPGFLDGVINGWHDFFQLPDGGRRASPNGRLLYRYQSQSLPDSVDLSPSGSGLGDVTLELQRLISQSETSSVSAVGGLELDSGNSGLLRGSGAMEGFLAIRMSADNQSQLDLSWHGQLGYSRAKKVATLGDLARHHLWFGSLSLGVPFADDWSLWAQLDAHTGPFDAGMDALDSTAGLLSLAVRWQAAEHWSIEAGFSEDIAVETAPDVMFFSRVRYSP